MTETQVPDEPGVGTRANFQLKHVAEANIERQAFVLDQMTEATADRVPIARLADVPWACCQPGTGHREMQVRVCRELGGFEPDLRDRSDDFLILPELVRTTGAGALLPDLVLGHSAPGVAIRLPAEGSVGRQVFLLTRRTQTPAVAAVVDALRAAATASL